MLFNGEEMKHFLFDKWKAPDPKRFHSNSIIRTYSSVYIQIASRSLYIKLKTYFTVLTTIHSTIPHNLNRTLFKQFWLHFLASQGSRFSKKIYFYIFPDGFIYSSSCIESLSLLHICSFYSTQASVSRL